MLLDRLASSTKLSGQSIETNLSFSSRCPLFRTRSPRVSNAFGVSSIFVAAHQPALGEIEVDGTEFVELWCAGQEDFHDCPEARLRRGEPEAGYRR
jgi:hypothetical protein